MSEETKAKKTVEKAQETEVAQDEVVTTPAPEVVPAAVVTAEQAGTFVYIGPNLPNGLLKMGSVFKGTRSEVLKHLEHVTAKYPEAAQLVVSSDKLAESKVRLQNGGNLLASNYTKLVTSIKNK